MEDKHPDFGVMDQEYDKIEEVCDPYDVRQLAVC